jgi:hypothetical protein
MLINVRGIGATGVISDVAAWDLPPNALTDGRNFRVMAGKIQSSGGSKMVNVNGSASGDIGHILQSSDFEGNSSWIVCTDSTLESYTEQKFHTVLDIGREVDEHAWTSCQIGQVTFINNPSLNPVYFTDWSTGAEQAIKLPWVAGGRDGDLWEDRGVSARIIQSHKNFVFAMGMTEPDPVTGLTTYYEDRVRWSHPCEPNGVPYTWEGPDVDRSSLAGFVTLGRGGKIVGAESLRDSFVIYSDKALNVLDFTGDALVWRRRTLSQNAGLIGRDALVEVSGRHYFISNEDILMFDGNQAQSLLHDRLRKRFASTLNEDARHTSFATHHKTMGEIWFCVAEEGYDEPNMAYVYNYRDNTWSLRDLSTERTFSHACYGNQPTEVSPWDGWEGIWANERQTWATANRQAFDGVLVGASGPDVYNIDTQNPDEADLLTFVERTHMPIVGHEDVSTITRLYPQVEGKTPVKVHVGSHHYAGDAARWAGDKRDFSPATDRKVDVRTTGELHSWRVEGPTNGNFNISGVDIEWQPAGTR